MFDVWMFRMAWRDSRGSRRRFVLFLSSMVLGVAALVAINAFGENLRRAIDEEAKTLLGADLSLEANGPFSPETEALIDSLGGRQARRISFPSMALFPETGDTRLATVRAVEGDYPFYGEVETAPAGAAAAYLDGPNALVDGTLMRQFGVDVGDSVQIGERGYRIAGELVSTPRESAAVMLFSPRIYIPMAELDTTLLATGSRAEYEVYFQFERGRDVEALVEEIEPTLRERRIGFDTVSEVKENWNEGLANLYRFLGLIGFVALLLGGLGVASAIHVYVKGRVETVAVLRCVGAEARRTFGVYLVQAAALGLVGGLVGCLVGLGVQTLLPRLLADFLPVDVQFTISWSAMALGLGIGLGVTVLFALLPLLAVRRISPLRALRAPFEAEAQGDGRDPWRWAVFALIAATVTLFALVQAPTPLIGLGYAVGVAAVFGLLALVAQGIVAGAQRFFPSSWSYVWRQGLANLYRPQNQTRVLMLALGLGTFLILTLVLAERTLLSQIQIAGGDGRPNTVLFDVQPEQLEGVTGIVEEEGLPVFEEVPIVTMRLAAVNGRTVDEMREDSTTETSWAHRREYRSTYRDVLNDAETVVEGAFDGAVPEASELLPAPEVAAPGRVVPVSIEEELAREELGVGLGDTLVFDVQGVPVTTEITSIREVDWQRFSTNFFVVFPTGVLEEAPQTYVVLTRTPSADRAAQLQSRIVAAYPNVSAIDLSIILSVFDAIFSRVAFVIRFMALFSILTGLIVLAGAVLVSRYQRVQESVLLKTLGASKRQVFQIMLVEYFFLGLFASVAGLVLALGGGWALALFVFDTAFAVPLLRVLLVAVAVVAVTMGIGLVISRGLYRRTPLEVLRGE